MADRGFTIHESVCFHQAELSIPAFTKGKDQLDPIDLEKTRGIAKLMLESMYMLNVLLASYAKSILFFKGHFQLMVMADRGFAIHESVWFHQAELSIPAFTKGKDHWTLLTLRKLEGLQMLESMLNVLLAYYAKSILFFKGHFQLIFCLLMVTNAQ